MTSPFTARLPVRNEAGQTYGWIVWDALGDVSGVDGMHVPSEFHLRYPGSPEQPSLQVTFGIRDGAPVCTALTIESKTQGREVRPQDFEIIRRELANWSEQVITSVMHHQSEAPSDVIKAPDFTDAETARRAYRESRKRRRRKVNDQLLSEVAALYRDSINDGPWRAIADHYGVSETTAARYVLLARKAGLLPPTESGRKKA